MIPDSMGFLYPAVNTSLCADCGLCDKVCQFHNDYNRYGNFEEPKVYGCRHKDIDELSKSQSGAASWAIIQSFLRERGIVYGVGYKSVTHIAHKRATTIGECEEFRGSKYVQSDIRGVFEQVKTDLSNGERVLFFGTGCQVAGLKSFIPTLLHQNLFTVDIVCHAAPSPAVWKSYIEYKEKTYKNKVIKVNFRDQCFGWHFHKESFVFSDGIKRTDSIFRELFYEHMIIRPSCTNCPFVNFKRVSDITLADFWGWEKHYKEWNDNKGVSLFLVNSAKGDLMKRESEQYLDFIESDTAKCLQPQLQYPVQAHPDSDKIAELFARKGFKGIAKKYGYIPGYKYYKNRAMPYVHSAKNKIAKLIGLDK